MEVDYAANPLSRGFIFLTTCSAQQIFWLCAPDLPLKGIDKDRGMACVLINGGGKHVTKKSVFPPCFL
jgi:hypothetical protein